MLDCAFPEEEPEPDPDLLLLERGLLVVASGGGLAILANLGLDSLGGAGVLKTWSSSLEEEGNFRNMCVDMRRSNRDK